MSFWLLAEVFGQLFQAAQILEDIPPILEAFDITDIHVIEGKGAVDGAEGVDRRSIRIQNDQYVIAKHARSFS